MSNKDIILDIKNLHHSYKIGNNVLEVLKGISWEVPRGSFVCLLGASGSGKTTLLNLIGALERPESGDIIIDGVSLGSLKRRECAMFRRQKIGFIFQAYHLLPELSILENVLLPAMLDGKSWSCAKKEAEKLLEIVGLKERMHHRPGELSGGEQQRAAISRSLINNPPLLLADEPTGNLDVQNGALIMDVIKELRSENPQQSIVMITHNRDLAKETDILVELVDGKLI